MTDGILAKPVTDWLSERASVTPPVAFDLVAGGRSNLTFTITDAADRRWVLRRPPLHSVLASAHDVGREYRIMAALQPTDVPVPPLVGHEPTGAVTGAPFYVMEFVDGLVPRDEATITSTLDPAARQAAAFNLADTLAQLHAVDVDDVGLGDLAKRSNYIARQLHRLSGQYDSVSQRDLPVVHRVKDRLANEIPEQGPPAIVHGDYRLDNLIVGNDGAIRSVLDWELCTLGDPLADVGLLTVYWATQMPMIPAAGRIPGVPPIEDVIARYGQQSGRDLSHLDYYVAFGYWKLAIILEGVYARFSAGAYGQADDSHTAFRDLVPQLLQEADSRIA